MAVEAYSVNDGLWSFRVDEVESGRWFNNREAAVAAAVLAAGGRPGSIKVVHEREAHIVGKMGLGA